MGLILLEALGALLLLVLIVWWTMFSGRRNGEPADTAANDMEDAKHVLSARSDKHASEPARQQEPARGKP